MLQAHQLRFAYPSGEFSLQVPGLTVGAGEVVGLGGASGTGKTTVLKLLSGILLPQSGQMELAGEALYSQSGQKLRESRLLGMGLIFQDFALLNYLTVEDNVLLPMRLSGRLNDAHKERARELVNALEIEKHWKRPANELSQGECQRVAIARALVHEPMLVLADEPTSSLDAKRKVLVMDLLIQYVRNKKAALLMVTHDGGLSSQLDRIVNVEEWTS
ncbi:MAG: hypothetical protein RL693_180 [Verrucomicrobiota bacterium]|jgi:putative ABC transport system ATP-binding protein